MNKFIKSVCVAAAAVFMLVSFSGCGKGRTQEAMKTGDGRIQIEYWYGLGGNLDENMRKIVDEFNASQSEYEVKAVPQDNYDTTYQKLQSAIAAKKTPAAVLLEADTQYSLGKKGLLTDFRELSKGDSSFNEEDYLESLRKPAEIDGKLVGVPIYGTTQVLYYNTSMFKDAGLSEDNLKTWTDLSEAASKLEKKNGDDITCYGWEPMWGEDNLIDMALSNGGQIISDDGKTVTINTEEWIEAWESARKWIHEDKTMRIHSGGQGWQYWNDTLSDALAGKSAGYTGSAGDQGDLDFNIVSAAEQPAFKEGKEAKPVAEGRFLAIPANCSEEEKKGAYEFLKFFNSSKVNAQWAIASGYIAANKESVNDEAFKKYVEDKPYALVPVKQAQHASPAFVDPTSGKITDALNIAADKVEIENVPAEEALNEAQKKAQEALDAVNK